MWPPKMIRILSVLCLCLLQISQIQAKCLLNIDTKAIFIQKFGENHMIFRPDTDVTIRERETIQVYCPSGFTEEPIRDVHSQEHNLEASPYLRTVSCVEGHIKGLEYYHSEYDYSSDDAYKRHNLKCIDSSPNFYEGDIPSCSKTGFYYGFAIKDVPIIFAEICYDLDKMETVFIHYIASERPPILERQEQYNPTKFINASQLIQKATFTAYDTSTMNLPCSEKQLEQVIDSSLQHFAEVSKYSVGELVSLKKSAGSLRKLIDGIELPNIIPWWSTLKKVNWKYYEQLLAQQARRVSLEVYAGQSGSVTYPTQGKCDIAETITYEQSSFERQIPKYIWNYIRTPETSGVNDIVVVAVNTPFLSVTDLETLPCEDMCDSIPWLKQLNKTRKYPAYGYIFCCRPEDVYNSLDGFPNVLVGTSTERIRLEP